MSHNQNKSKPKQAQSRYQWSLKKNWVLDINQINGIVTIIQKPLKWIFYYKSIDWFLYERNIGLKSVKI